MQVNEQSCERIRTSYSDIEPLAVQSISFLGIRKNSRYETLFWFGDAIGGIAGRNSVCSSIFTFSLTKELTKVDYSRKGNHKR